MMENRSFDHVLGALTLEGKTDVDGVSLDRSNADTLGRPRYAGRLAGARARRFRPDPPHDPSSVLLQLSEGMGGFVKAFERRHLAAADPGDVMRFLTRAELPITYFLADEFTVCDRWFCPQPGPSVPNRLVSLSGHSAGHRDNPRPRDCPFGIEVETLFDHLEDDWIQYAGSIPVSLLISPLRERLLQGQKLRSLSRFFEDAAHGRLPALSWIDPVYSWAEPSLLDPSFPEPTDDHPPSDVARGQTLFRRVYQALVENAEVWRGVVLVVTYSQHGGFYDHVQPPTLAAEERDPALGFESRGPRVPAIVVSPYAERQGVCHQVFDHVSVLRFICDWKKLPHFHPRIARAASLAAALTEDFREDVPHVPADPLSSHLKERSHELIEPHEFSNLLTELAAAVDEHVPGALASVFAAG